METKQWSSTSNNQLKVGIHSLGYVAESTKEAVDDFFPGYAHTMNKIGKGTWMA